MNIIEALILKLVSPDIGVRKFRKIFIKNRDLER